METKEKESSIYSMSESHPRGGVFTDRDAHGPKDSLNNYTDNHFKDAQVKERRKTEVEVIKTEHEKQRHLIFWRVGIGVLILLLIVGIIYFIGKGFNWGVSKIAGQSAMLSYVPALHSNADPNSPQPTEPVISNTNIYPVNSPGTSGGAVLGANQVANNCPSYVSQNYYYCEWDGADTFRPYRTKAEFDAAHAAVTNPQPIYSPVTYSTPPYTFTPATSYPADSTSSTASQQIGGIAANNCPTYAATWYAYCVWDGKYIFRGFRAGE